MTHPVASFLHGSGVLLIHRDLRGTIRAPQSVTQIQLPARLSVTPGEPQAVAVALPDVSALRVVAAEVAAGVPAVRTVTGTDEAWQALPDIGLTRRIAVWLAEGDVLSLRPDPLWRLELIRSHSVGERDTMTVLRFAVPVPVREVIAELGRQVVWGDRDGHGGVWIAPSEERAHDATLPADIVIGADTTSWRVNEVLGRRPAGMRLDTGPLAEGPLALGPIDERRVNPIGYIGADPTSWGRFDDDDVAATIDGAALVRSRRSQVGVLIDWPTEPVVEMARGVAALAVGGTPLVGAPPAWAERWLGEPVSALLRAEPDLTDPLTREEHSIELRRAGWAAYSTPAWRRQLARLTDRSVPVAPTVSVVLATKREDMLAHALEQVARQRIPEVLGSALELVLAPHGFDVDVSWVRDQVGDGVALQVVPLSEGVLFGDVLAAAAAAAGGDLVLKMDDDDWYSADAIADLLMAHSYSGAQVVGMPAEFHYLAPVDVTVKRGHGSEEYSRFVAGGTLMIERDLLREVGSFRSVRKFVDAQLLSAALAAGAAVYRTHGLGYCLRRNASGHTWQVDMDYLLDPSRVERRWDGFRPSRLLLT